MKNTQSFKNTQNFYIDLCGDEPAEYISCWTREFEFNLTVEENGTEKDYHGYYWWDSKGNDGIEWDEFNEKPNFGEHESKITNQIKAKVKKLLKELAEEEGKDDFWMIPE